MTEARMPDPNRPLFISTGKHVCALDPVSGTELWRTQLPRMGVVVSLLFSDGRLYAAGGGNVWGIDPANGRILWNNNLPGTGYGAVIMTREGSDPQQEAVAAAAEAAARAARDNGS
jgi:outer membrane protein assembly factor BamB